MTSKRAPGPDSYRQAYVETASEDSDASSDEDPSDQEEVKAPVPRPTPANVGTKRSDPSIAQKKNKYATSDSGYSSLTATTASSSQSKKATEQPTTTTKIKQKLAQTLKMPPMASAAAPRPISSRRMSERHERTARELRSVESREEAARMSLAGASTRATTSRRPSIQNASKQMPGGYPPSPKGDRPAPPALPAAIPRPVQRIRAATTTQAAGPRPATYHEGSVPAGYQIAYSGQPTSQHYVVDPSQTQQYQAIYTTTAQPMYANVSAAQYSGSYGSAYTPTPTSGSPYGQGFHYAQFQQYPQPHPQQQAQPYYTQSGAGYPGVIGDYTEAHRRMSMTYNAGYGSATQPYYEPQLPVQHHGLRRMSQSVQHTRPMFPPPAAHAADDSVFFDDDEDPSNYYRGFKDLQGIVDREQMPPPLPPPKRPGSSHRARPSLPHARTTSTARQLQRLSRGSIEYAPELSPRKTSFDATRPPSRPGMPKRSSTTAAHAGHLVRVHAEPSSPVRTRRRPNSIYEQPDFDPTLHAAEAYQHERTGGFGPSVDVDELPPLSRRQTKSSDTGSKGSRTSGEKHARRSNRQSLDKSRLREAHDRGVELSVNGVRLDLQAGSSVAIKKARDTVRSGNAASTGSSHSSSKPTRESSQARPDFKRYISGSNSTSSSKGKEKGDMEVPRQRRSSSVQPRIGRDEDGLVDAVRRLHTSSRQSRRSSRSGRVPLDR